MDKRIAVGLCIEPLFTEVPFVDRIAKVASLGFRTIEFWDPVGKDLPAIRRACEAAGVTISDCTFAECWGENRLHAETAKVVESFRKTIPMLKQLGTNKAIVLTGETQSGKSAAAQRARVVENLKALAPIAAREGITILLEALNSLVDHKGYFLDSATAGFDVIREVDHSSVRLLYDVYHMQIMEGNIIDSVTRNVDLIGHFHAAGVPGRHELFTGELDYRHILEAIDKAGYRGAFGLEYWPTMDHAESLRKTAEYLGLGGRS
jgi:hydroxypyruvate isomerase